MDKNIFEYKCCVESKEKAAKNALNYLKEKGWNKYQYYIVSIENLI